MKTTQIVLQLWDLNHTLGIRRHRYIACIVILAHDDRLMLSTVLGHFTSRRKLTRITNGKCSRRKSQRLPRAKQEVPRNYIA